MLDGDWSAEREMSWFKILANNGLSNWPSFALFGPLSPSAVSLGPVSHTTDCPWAHSSGQLDSEKSKDMCEIAF